MDPWRVSLHGGHSGAFCDHAKGELWGFLEAAVAQGFDTYGVSEHAPRVEGRFLYPGEIEMGWDVAKLIADFESYVETITALAREFDGRLTVLRGFETETVPADRYAKVMLDLRERHSLDYMVGSVHYVDDFLFDYDQTAFDRAVELQGGFEALLVRYYETVAEMVATLRPEVVGHFDVIRRFAMARGAVDGPVIRRAAAAALEVVREHDCILDLNTAPLRRGEPVPYPAPWAVELARGMGIPFCFGDDSHDVGHVGAGIGEGREYLLAHGVNRITVLTKEEGVVGRREVPLT